MNNEKYVELWYATDAQQKKHQNEKRCKII